MVKLHFKDNLGRPAWFDMVLYIFGILRAS